MTAGVGDIVRKTSFVAYGEATIDELYYLAQEHANREVGAGQEAYNVKVGSMGTPLVGDDTRQSWPSTYKVRQSRLKTAPVDHLAAQVQDHSRIRRPRRR